MNNNFDQFIRQAKEVKLNEEEKASARAQLAMHVAKDGVQLTEEEKQASKQNLQMFMNAPKKRSRFFHLSLHSLTAALAIVVLFSGSLAYAAEDTVPGDMLYPVKVDIVEPIRGRFKFTPEARAKWNARRIERRLEEGQRLMSREDRFAKHLPKLQERLELHTQRLEEHLAKLESVENAEEIRSHMEKTLERHEAMLDSIESGDVQPEEVRRFMHHVKQRRERIRSLRRPDRVERRDTIAPIRKEMMLRKRDGNRMPSDQDRRPRDLQRR